MLEEEFRKAAIEARKKCEHEHLQFGSGDYYVICVGCGTYWMKDRFWDGADSPNLGDDETNHTPRVQERSVPIGLRQCHEGLEKFYPPDEKHEPFEGRSD